MNAVSRFTPSHARLAPALPDRREQILVLAESRLAQRLFERILLHVLEHGIYGQHADDLVMKIFERRRDQVVALERFGGFVVGVAREEIRRRRVHDFVDMQVAVAHEQPVERQRALEHVVAVDHRQRRELRGQAAAPAQRREGIFERDVRENRHDLELHDRADDALGERQHDCTSARSCVLSCASTASTRSCGRSCTRSAKSSASIC
jgi:hypothetical protein